MNFAKILKFYREKQLLITIALCVVLLFLSCFWHPIMYVLMVLLLASMIFLNVNDILCLSVFLLPFSGFLIIFIGSSIYMFLIILVKYIISIVKKQEKIYKLPLIITLAIIIVFSSVFYGTNDYGALQGVLIVCILLFMYLLFVYRKQIHPQSCLKYLLVGLTISAAMGFVFYYIPSAKMFTFTNWNYGMYSIKSLMFIGQGAGRRLALLSFHVNHLYVFCIFGIVSVAYYFLSKNKKTILGSVANLVGFGVCSVVGILTLSKGFFILFILAILLFLILVVVTYKKRSLIYVLPVVVIGITFVLIFKDEVIMVLERFTNHISTGDDSTDSLFNSITTGRVNIWNKFLDETFSTPLKALFGVGLFSADIVDVGPHNLYVSLIYRFGIFGLMALALLFWSYYYSLEERPSFSVFGIMPLILFLFLALEEACLDERLYFLIFSVMMMFYREDEPQQSTTTKETEDINSEIKDKDDKKQKKSKQIIVSNGGK